MSYKFAENISTYNEYEQKIQRILDSPSLDFLSPHNLVGVFHVDNEFTPPYCQQILKEFPTQSQCFREGLYTEKLRAFQAIGQQHTFYSPELQCDITPNASRYIYHALLISKYIREKFLSTPIDVVEIGGGYGGLCYWLRTFDSSIMKYSIVDLPRPLALQQKVLSQLKTSCEPIHDSSSYVKGSRPVFIISNYGYSEFNQHFQELYKKTLLQKADGGFMVWNNWTGIYNFTDLPMRVEPERPVFKDVPNKFIFF
jgi:hypothetical protein